MTDGHGTGEKTTDDAAAPLLRVVRGEPDATELAALTAVVAALGSGEPAPEPPSPPTRWADPASRLGLGALPGPGGWRSSAYPA